MRDGNCGVVNKDMDGDKKDGEDDCGDWRDDSLMNGEVDRRVGDSADRDEADGEGEGEGDGTVIAREPSPPSTQERERDADACNNKT